MLRVRLSAAPPCLNACQYVSEVVQQTRAVCISCHPHLGRSLVSPLHHLTSMEGAVLRSRVMLSAAQCPPHACLVCLDSPIDLCSPASLAANAWHAAWLPLHPHQTSMGLCCAQSQAECSLLLLPGLSCVIWASPADLCSVLWPTIPGIQPACQFSHTRQAWQGCAALQIWLSAANTSPYMLARCGLGWSSRLVQHACFAMYTWHPVCLPLHPHQTSLEGDALRSE